MGGNRVKSVKTTVAGLLAAAAVSGPAQAAGPTAKLDAGVVQGAQSGELMVFKGVPYAASTAGAFRWRAPQPVPAWTGVRASPEMVFDAHPHTAQPTALEEKIEAAAVAMAIKAWDAAR